MSEIIEYWDDTLKKYVEVSTTTPLPTNAVGGGSGGAEEVEITSANGAATTGQGNADGRAASDIGLLTNSRNYGFNGTTWDRIHATTGSLHTVITQGSNTAGVAGYAGSDAWQTTDLSLSVGMFQAAFNGTTWDRVRSVQALSDGNAGLGLPATGLYGYNGTTFDRLRSTSGSLDVATKTVPTVGTHGNAWNAATVAVDGVSASVDCQYVSNVSVFGNSSVAGSITLQYSQDNTNFYDDDLNSINTGGNNFALNSQIGARYIRLKSDTASTITATIAGKA